jgi:hypothetical protein
MSWIAVISLNHLKLYFHVQLIYSNCSLFRTGMAVSGSLAGPIVGGLCMAASAVGCVFTLGFGCAAIPACLSVGLVATGVAAVATPTLSEACRICEATHDPDKVK